MSYLETAKACLETLRHRPNTAGVAAKPDTASAPTFEGIANMSLDDFAGAGKIVRVHSQALGCKVLLVSDNVPDEEIEAEGLPVYRVAEMKKLALLRPEPHSLRQIHEVKTIFNGTIEEVADE